MAIVVGSPIPAEELGLGALESLISVTQMSRPTYCGCAHLLEILALNHTFTVVAVTVFLFYEFCEAKYVCSCFLKMDY